LVKQGEGIQVYTAAVGTTGRKYIKVTAALTGTLEQVKTVFRNIAQQKAWVYGTKQSYLLERTTENNLLYYNETALPWPVSNRDVAIHMQLIEDSLRQVLVITQQGMANAAPVHKGIVRVPHLVGHWEFRNEGNSKLQAVYLLDIDPGGSVPLWLVNLFVAKGPYETFVKLQQQLRG
jgi:hypothetical protein